MATVILAGDSNSALTHLALLGAAAIVRAGLPDADVTVCWQNDGGWRAVLDVADLSGASIGAVVAEHAGRRIKPDSWVGEDIDHEGRVTAVFSPRIKVAGSREAWEKLQERRLNGIDALPMGLDGDLDRRFIQSLGEPAYWRTGPNGYRADEGASRLEMKTRNRGEEFIQNRLRLLATSVSARSNSDVIDGLTGSTLRDEVGKNKADSRTATGFTVPGPVDNAVAWCALWGISQFPVIPQVSSRSATCGFISGRGVESALAIPMPIWPVTPARMRALMLGRHVVAAARRTDSRIAGSDLVEADVAAEYLRARGVGIIMRFPWWSSSGNAPEFRLLSGIPVRLGDPGAVPG